MSVAQGTSKHNFAVDLAHDFGGAILFSFPLLMTMEMWWLGFYMDRSRLALFLTLAVLMVVGLSYFEGRNESFKIEILDALVACAAGYAVAAVMLSLFFLNISSLSVAKTMASTNHRKRQKKP